MVTKQLLPLAWTALAAREVQMTLCPKILGMSQVTTQVSETKISDALVTGHTGVWTAQKVQYFTDLEISLLL